VSKSAPEAEDPENVASGPPPPAVIADRYVVERELGRGGMGRVLVAFDPRLGRRVAIKMLVSGVPGEAALRRFEVEARAAGSLNHPNVVDVHDVGVWQGEPYIVSELLDGETLAERLRRGPLPQEDAVALALQLAAGLSAAHERGIVHRDLKPENLFVTKDGRLKILDFGIAKLLEQPGNEPGASAPRSRTETGAILGTVAYMSPEQVRGRSVDQRSDVFSCGAILHEMLAGTPAFAGETNVETGYAILNAEPPPLPASVDEKLERIVRRCLEKDPQRRYQSASDLSRDLSAFARGEGISVAPGGISPARRRRIPRAAAWAIAAALATAAGAFLGYRFARHPGGGTAADVPSIAVLAFADLSPGRDQEYFSDGLAEEILDALAHVPGLRVAGRISSFSFKGKSDDLQSIAQKLHVRTVLEGSVRREGDRLRITAQLIDAADGFHLWSQTFERKLSGVFAVQEEISLAVVRALREHLHLGGTAQPPAPRETTPEAHREYLIAKQLLNRGSASGFRRAQEGFSKAVEIDPSYAPAWAGLALAAWYWSNLAATPDEARTATLGAMAAADRAVSLAPDMAEAVAVRGYLRSLVSWDWDGAYADVEKAVSLNGGSAPVWSRYGLVLASLGRLPDALAAARKAAELDPLSAEAWDNLAYVANGAGDSAAARSAAKRALEIAPEQAYAIHHLVVAALLEGRPAEALKAFDESAEEIFRLQAIAMAQHDLGHRAEADRALARLVEKYANSWAFQIAQAYAWRGENDRAFEWLDRSYRQRDGGLGYVKCDALLKRIRGDARYAALLRKMNLPQ
jgi:serine/threonine-protein kinase